MVINDLKSYVFFQVNRLLDFLIRMLRLPIDKKSFPDDLKRIRARIIFSAHIVYFLSWGFFAILYFYLHAPMSASIALYGGVLSSIISIIIIRWRSAVFLSGFISNFSSSTALFLLSTTTGSAFSALLPWLMALMMSTYLQLSRKAGLILTAYILGLFILITVLSIFDMGNYYELPFGPESTSFVLFTVSNFIIASLALVLVIIIFTQQFENGYLKLQQSEQEIKKLNRELFEMAHTDELTKLYNRRALLIFASRELRRAQRSQKTLMHFRGRNTNPSLAPSPDKELLFKSGRKVEDYVGCLSVAILDLDHFKRINDKYGHETGDRVLQAFSNIMTDTFRKTDIIGRYGGEEFLVIFPDTSCELACIALEKLSKKVRETPILNNNKNIDYCFSGGLTEAKSNDRSIDQLIKRADEALYLAKDKGRERIEINLPIS